MKQEFRISTEQARGSVIAHLRSLPLDPVSVVEIGEETKDRSLAQNRLYRKWVQHIATVDGQEQVNDLYLRYKRDILLPIYERDDVKGYVKLMASLRDLWKIDRVKGSEFLNHVADQATTLDANMKQFSEYLEGIEHDAIKLMVQLPYPELRGIAIK